MSLATISVALLAGCAVIGPTMLSPARARPGVAPGDAGPVPSGGPAAEASEGVVMVLEASVNTMPTHQLLTVRRQADGRFLVAAAELRRVRIEPGVALTADADVDLAAAGIVALYDEASQSIALNVPVRLLMTYRVDLGGSRTPIDLASLKPVPALLLNYGLYLEREPGLTQLSGNLEAVASTSAGVFSSTGLFNTAPGYGGQRAVRLDSSWRFVDPVAIRSYTIGDFTSNALSWTSSVRLGGFQISSAFEQRSDLVTTALPQFSGSAALPSTLDLYVNQQRIYSGQVPAGPFDLRALPYLTGGDVRLVTTDATGRQVEIDKSYYYVAQQLRRGILQYSLDVGAPRLDYSLDSFHYDDVLFASGGARYGVSDHLTLEGHGEASSDGLWNGGLGVVQSIGGIGAISGSFAASSYHGQTGHQFSIQAEAQRFGIRVFAGTQRVGGDYFDLARVSIARSARRFASGSDLDEILGASARATAVDRAGFSFIPWFDPVSVSVSYNRITGPDTHDRTASLSLSRALGNRLSFYASGFVGLGADHDLSLFATLNFRFGKRITASVGVQRDGGRTGFVAQASSAATQAQGAVGWGVTDREYEDGAAQRSAYLSYLAPQALLRGQIDESDGSWRGSFEADGSVVAAGGQVFLANRIGDSFAIVTDAGPHVDILQGGVRMGKTDGEGRALLPDLIPYYGQHILIDPTSLPDGWEAEATDRVAVAGWRQGTMVDFGVHDAHGAVVALHFADGTPVPAGALAQLAGGAQALVGYDGQVYLQGLSPTNHLLVDMGRGSHCAADFAYDASGPAQPQIGPVACR